jgi:aldose sugar dehydrogenase
MKRYLWLGAVCVILLPSAVTRGQQPSRAATGEPNVFNSTAGRIRAVPVATGLVSAYSMVFLPEGDLLVVERPGRIRIIRKGVLLAEPIMKLPPEPLDPKDGEGSDRLHFLALHPKFAENRLVYFSYAKFGERGNTLAVARGRFDKGATTLADIRDVFVADAWSPKQVLTGGSSVSGKLLFGSDGTLYVMVGDRDVNFFGAIADDSSARMEAQNLSNHKGKTLRIKDDGSVPPDNPFVNRPDVKPEIFTYGHRVSFGLAQNPANGEVWASEIGPLGGDELNILLPGRNYGWPLVSTGHNYSGRTVSDQPWWRPGIEMPQMSWVPAVSPAGIWFYTGDQFPKWKGSLFVGALTPQELERFPFDPQSQKVLRPEPLLTGAGWRIRDVIQGPDGNLYVATESRYGESTPKGTIQRIEPAK